jgi:hypothetical protein
MQVLSFTERAKSLENVFFQRVDQQLLGNIRGRLEEHDAITALRAASGVRNDELLAELVRIEVQPETLAAVTLIPLVAVAWADGKVTDAERRKILAAEHAAGIGEDAPSHQLLNHWLDHNPGPDLFATWKH